MTMDFTWKIVSKDDSTGTMVVEYSSGHTYNIPQPPIQVQDVDEWVKQFLPSTVHTPIEYHDLQIGHEGSFTVYPPVVEAPEDVPNVTGNWNEEYLRAMIYQVLEEIKEAQV